MWCRTISGGRWTVSTGLAKELMSVNSNVLLSAQLRDRALQPRVTHRKPRSARYSSPTLSIFIPPL